MKKQRDVDALNRAIDARIELHKERPRWSEGVIIAVISGVCSLILGFGVPIAKDSFEDEKSPCSILNDEVAKAVESGIDDPENLKPLARDGCSRSPVQIAKDILDD